MRPLGALALIVLAGLAAWLAVANRDAVIFSIDAMRTGATGTEIRVPLFAVMLVGVLLGLVVGAAYMAAPQRTLLRQLRAEQARANHLQRLLADETLAKHESPSSIPSRISG